MNPEPYIFLNPELMNTFNSIVRSATPLIIASLGETITERAGMINLSLNGSLLLSALAGFVVAKVTGSIALGVLAAAFIGALIAAIIGLGAIQLRQDQVALGFVLTLLAEDMAKFLGSPYNRQPGLSLGQQPIPLLSTLPDIGPIFFNQNLFVYFSYFLIFALWWWLFRSRPGLAHRAIGEHPEAAFARGTSVNQWRFIALLVGGALAGVAGAAYSLDVKAGWAASPAMDGDGWIALAIVIFGGWHPFRVAFGAYLFAALRAAASAIQRSPDLNIPLVLLNALPWLLMIGTLMLVSTGVLDRLLRAMPASVQRHMRQILRSDPPAALGRTFEANS
jgi:general nucleoside transport system permease protein